VDQSIAGVEATLSKHQGAVLSDRHIALYRDDEGQVHALSSVCTHEGCDVEWNDEEKVWDCPCHGSRFGPMGDVLIGPAVEPLPPVDLLNPESR
jgi:Rieske Fe-S protein